MYWFLIGITFLSFYGLGGPASAIYLQSENGDLVGKNEMYIFDQGNGFFEVEKIKPTQSLKGFTINFHHAYEDSWQFKFVVPTNQKIEKNIWYKKAYNYPYQYENQAGIKASPIQYDFLNLRGEFKILDFTIDEQGIVTSLAIDFKQVSEKKGVLFGSIRYQSSLPISSKFDVDLMSDLVY